MCGRLNEPNSRRRRTKIAGKRSASRRASNHLNSLTNQIINALWTAVNHADSECEIEHDLAVIHVYSGHNNNDLWFVIGGDRHTQTNWNCFFFFCADAIRFGKLLLDTKMKGNLNLPCKYGKSLHIASPNTKSRSSVPINVMGMHSTPSKISEMAKFNRNTLVMVRIRRFWINVRITNALPIMANNRIVM